MTPRLPDAWYAALIWLLYTVLGILIPMGGGLLVVAAVSKVTLADFTDGGQFAVYTTALLTGTVYVIAKPAKPGSLPRLPWTEWFLWFAGLGIFTAATFFTLALLLSSGKDVQAGYFRWPSVGLAILSLVVAFLAVGLDIQRASRSVEDELQRQFNNLQSAIDSKLSQQDDGSGD